jgi:hypothetical protein
MMKIAPVQNSSSLFTGFLYTDPLRPEKPGDVLNDKTVSTLKTRLSASVTTSVYISTNAGKFSSFEWVEYNTSTLGLQFESQVAGWLICSVEYGVNDTRNSQELYWRDADGIEEKRWVKEKVQAGEQDEFVWDFETLKLTSNDLTINCMICNDYPGAPNCSQVVSHYFVYNQDLGGTVSAAGWLAVVSYFFV